MNIFKVGFSESQNNRVPDASLLLLENANINISGFVVRKLELRQYVNSTDPHLGECSFITALIETDKGCIEIKFDEGYKGDRALNVWEQFLSHYVGYISLINRAVMELQGFIT